MVDIIGSDKILAVLPGGSRDYNNRASTDILFKSFQQYSDLVFKSFPSLIKKNTHASAKSSTNINSLFGPWA